MYSLVLVTAEGTLSCRMSYLTYTNYLPKDRRVLFCAAMSAILSFPKETKGYQRRGRTHQGT